METRRINAIDVDGTADVAAPEAPAEGIHEHVERMRQAGRAKAIKRATAAKKVRKSQARRRLQERSRRANRR